MKLLLALPLLLLAACTVPKPEYRRITALHYEAAGAGWHLTIGDETMTLTLQDPQRGPSSTSYATVTARTEGTVTVWTAGGGLGAPTVEARRAECMGVDGMAYEDAVTVSLSGRQLHGCGGERAIRRRG